MTVQLLHTLVLIGAAKSEPLITLELLTLLQVTWIAAHRASTTTFLSDYVKIQVFSKYHYNSLLGRSEYL